MKKVFVALLVLCIAVTAVFAQSSTETAGKELKTVRIAIHSNEGGASLAAIAEKQGIFEKHGIKANFTVVAGGVPEMAAMRSNPRDLDVGYIGAGVAWNPIDSTGEQLSFLFVDCLSNSENLIAKKGIFTDANGNGKYENSEIGDGLAGKTVYLQIGATPGDWFKNLVATINEERAEGEKLWIYCEDAAYTASYTYANGADAYKVFVVNYNNDTIPAGMATKDASSVQIAAAYAPATTSALALADVEFICDNSALGAQYVSPSTWVASNKWIAEDPETVQDFVDALVEAAQYRYEHMDEAMLAADEISGLPAGSCDAKNLIAFSLADYKELFADKDSKGYLYMKYLYEAKKGNVPEGTTPKTLEESFNDTFMVKAIFN